ncbi:MAG: hypothetical protein EHM36_12200 [Deltaproteobacteria bacterium]|nr:MAG: hypothetical protein EHM36_12200 [Deltaproteobacteria bacterium]
MGKPLFKVSDGGRFNHLREWEEVTGGELQQGSETGVPIRLKVRPEAFPTASPMSVLESVLRVNIRIEAVSLPSLFIHGEDHNLLK